MAACAGSAQGAPCARHAYLSVVRVHVPPATPQTAAEASFGCLQYCPPSETCTALHTYRCGCQCLSAGRALLDIQNNVISRKPKITRPHRSQVVGANGQTQVECRRYMCAMHGESLPMPERSPACVDGCGRCNGLRSHNSNNVRTEAGVNDVTTINGALHVGCWQASTAKSGTGAHRDFLRRLNSVLRRTRALQTSAAAVLAVTSVQLRVPTLAVMHAQALHKPGSDCYDLHQKRT